MDWNGSAIWWLRHASMSVEWPQRCETETRQVGFRFGGEQHDESPVTSRMIGCWTSVCSRPTRATNFENENVIFNTNIAYLHPFHLVDSLRWRSSSPSICGGLDKRMWLRATALLLSSAASWSAPFLLFHSICLFCFFFFFLYCFVVILLCCIA